MKFLGFGLFLHKLHHDEDVGIYHNHPWNGVSLILGSYLEQKLGGEPKRKRFFNYVNGKHHRVALLRPVWTVFLHFRRKRKWTVIDYDGQLLQTEPWRDTKEIL